MRVRLERQGIERSAIRWRGVALDTFDNQSWSKSNSSQEARAKGERDMIQVDYATGRDSLALQTFYLEPLDSPVIFGMPRPVGVQGNFPVIYRDKFRSLSFQRPFERTSYRMISDIAVPTPSELRADLASYTDDEFSYLELPADIDPRIAELTGRIVQNRSNRYDAATAVESYLQNNFGYTLEQKAGGSQPLSDFLFNIKEGHCEYFSTALAVMLRTQGIATRVVNGFQRGEYNETADVYVVRQKNAHSWVEVYFPGEKAWVPFDGTPYAGRESTAGAVGFTSRINQYMQALEAFWIEYFVAYDNQEQRSLYSSVKRGFSDFHRNSSAYLEDAGAKISQLWGHIRGDAGIKVSIFAAGQVLAVVLGIAGLVLLFVRVYRKVVKSKVWLRLRDRFFARRRASIVEFYERMQTVLESKGFKREAHQTPLEFAFSVSLPEAVRVTERYNDVRFGLKSLTNDEANEIETWLAELEHRSD
jgi:transglutaminase-like putative cysteine protease